MADHPDAQFRFNAAMAAAAETDLDAQIDALDSRVHRLVDAGKIMGIPLAGHIMSLTHDAEDIAQLGKVLQRIAELLPALDELRDKKTVLEQARKNPAWMRGVFGDDLADEVDAIADAHERGRLKW